MPLAAIWMQLDIIILSEVCQKERELLLITHRWNLKNDTKELIYKTETEKKLMVIKGERRGDKLGVWD